MSASTALPPAIPTGLPPAPPTDTATATTFEPPPLAVLPGDDLTRFILQYPPPKQPSSSGRKKKKSRKNNNSAAAAEDEEDDYVANKLPPKIGTGLICTHDPSSTSNPPIRIKSIIAGRLLYRPHSNTWYIASNPRRYHLSQSPISSTSLAKSYTSSNNTNGSSNNSGSVLTNMGVNDRIIGTITDSKASADYYRVNIFGSHSTALLHVFSFEGATKRNRPQLNPGQLVYCRILKGFGGGRMDLEVTCKVGGSNSNSSSGKSTHNMELEEDDDGGAARKDWMTNENTYGPLTGGTSFKISLGLARQLLLPNNACLSALDKANVPFEICIGVNGMVWINSPYAELTIMIMNAIKNSEVMDDGQVRGMVKVMVKNVRKELDE